ncbi:hypothetical protein HXX01_00015 [Candidatus Nomurabacteria bacterium]|nr:hypothetical protein [Candidatus Nomurabacteria bacterium]
MDKRIIESKYGPQSSGDNTFTAKARLLQSIYRVQSGETSMGIGPNKNSVDRSTHKPSYYGNMLADGEHTGKNFIFPETFKYAHERTDERKAGETIDKYRLFNNLLSSMPMAFNLFHPLMMIKEKYPDLLNCMIQDLFPELPVYKVDEIKLEYIPKPIKNYTYDKSAMDAAILFSDQLNNKYIIAIETKYTDSLGINEAKENELKILAATESGLFTNEGLEHINKGCSQIYRNFLLTEKYRLVHRLKDSFSIIMAPKDHPSTDREIKSLLKFLKPGNQYKLNKYSLEDFVSALGNNCPEEFQSWVKWFFDRYLDFDKVDSIMKELKLS